MRENNAGFVVPKKKEKTPSLDERIASNSGRAKQDIQAAKERESDKGKIIKQVADAKSESSVRSNPQYKSASAPDKIASTKPADINSGVDASPTNMGVSRGSTTGEKTEASTITPRQQEFVDSFKSTPEKTAPVVKKTAPVVKKAAPTSKYRGGRSEDDINRMIAEASPDRMKTAQPEIDRIAASARAEKLREDNPGMKRGGAVKSKAKSTCMKTGGMVKSGASRGDGCAIRGRTKGKYC